MGISGADADALERLGREFDRTARRVTLTERRLGRSLHAAPWRGRNADVFRHRWDTEHRRELLEAVAFMEDATRALDLNARQQRAASSALGGVVGSVAGGRPGVEPGVDPGQIVDMSLDLLDIIGSTPVATGFGIGIGAGAWDLLFRRDGYGGEYHTVESVMDLLGIGVAAFGLGALLVGAAPVVIGGAIIAGGLIKGADLLLGTGVGKSFLRGTAATGRSAWRTSASLVRGLWSGVRSIGESGATAIRDSAVRPVRRVLLDAPRMVGGVVEAGSRLVTGTLLTGRRLLPAA